MDKTRHRKRIAVYAALTAFVMLAIFIMSAQDGDESGSFSNGFLKSFIGSVLSRILPRLTDRGFDYDIRKYGHMFEYFCLGLCAFLMFSEIFLGKSLRASKTALSAWLLSFLYACSDEFHQRFVPGRAGRFTDVMIDSAGFTSAVLIMLAVFLLQRYFRSRKEIQAE